MYVYNDIDLSNTSNNQFCVERPEITIADPVKVNMLQSRPENIGHTQGFRVYGSSDGFGA